MEPETGVEPACVQLAFSNFVGWRHTRAIGVQRGSAPHSIYDDQFINQHYAILVNHTKQGARLCMNTFKIVDGK